MRRWLTGAVATVVVVTSGCAGDDPTRQRLNEQVASIRGAAAAGDLDAAQRALDQLQALVQGAVERGDLSREHARDILTAAAAVDQQLTALTEPPAQEPTSRPATVREPGTQDRDDEDDHDEKEKKEEEKKQEKEEEREAEDRDD